MICKDVGIKNCFNCWMYKEHYLAPTSEIEELACWINVNHRQIQMILDTGMTINQAFLHSLTAFKEYPLGEPDFPQEEWLKMTVRLFYPEHIDTLEKIMVLM